MKHLNCRGVALHEDPAVPEGAACRARVFLGTLDLRLVALDAATGRPCAGFGVGGTVELAECLKRQPTCAG